MYQLLNFSDFTTVINDEGKPQNLESDSLPSELNEIGTLVWHTCILKIKRKFDEAASLQKCLDYFEEDGMTLFKILMKYH